MLHYLGCTTLKGLFTQPEVYQPGARMKLEDKVKRLTGLQDLYISAYRR